MAGAERKARCRLYHRDCGDTADEAPRGVVASHERLLEIPEGYKESGDENEDGIDRAFGGVCVCVSADASFAPGGDRSRSGTVVLVNDSVVHWVSQKQSLVALSSCESELNAAVLGIRVGIGVRNMLEEMLEVDVGDPKMGDPVLCPQEDRRRTIPTTLKQDNMACITTITTEVTSWRSRHYALRAAWVRDRDV